MRAGSKVGIAAVGRVQKREVVDVMAGARCLLCGLCYAVLCCAVWRGSMLWAWVVAQEKMMGDEESEWIRLATRPQFSRRSFRSVHPGNT